jgi:hypothetical protein
MTPPPLPPLPPLLWRAPLLPPLPPLLGCVARFDAELFDAELLDPELRDAELFEPELFDAEALADEPLLRDRPLLDALVRLRGVLCLPLLLREELERLLLLFVPELVVAISPPGRASWRPLRRRCAATGT